jgi:hypothetical protein
MTKNIQRWGYTISPQTIGLTHRRDKVYGIETDSYDFQTNKAITRVS